MNELIIKQFESQDVGFRNNPLTGESEVRIDEVARFCGWTTLQKNGNETIRWSRVNEKLEELDYSKVGIGDFIPERIMYPLIGKANNERATKFMLWVGEMLVDIRKNGYYELTCLTKMNLINEVKKSLEMKSLEILSEAMKHQEELIKDLVKPSSFDKKQIEKHIKDILGTNDKEAYERVKKMIYISLGAKKWEDIPLYKLQASIEIMHTACRIEMSEREDNQTTLFDYYKGEI